MWRWILLLREQRKPSAKLPVTDKHSFCFDQELQHYLLLYMIRCNNLSLFSSV